LRYESGDGCFLLSKKGYASLEIIAGVLKYKMFKVRVGTPNFLKYQINKDEHYSKWNTRQTKLFFLKLILKLRNIKYNNHLFWR